jgi:EAL domain-containing protein (putative c-di-GMP-specific phosphodiesterase class I)
VTATVHKPLRLAIQTDSQDVPGDGDLEGADGLRQETYPPGATIYSEGELGHCGYLIIRGCVRTTARRGDREVEVATLGSGMLLGAMSLIESRPRTTTAQALEATALLPIPRDHLQGKLKRTAPLVRMLLKVALERVRELEGHSTLVEPTTAGLETPDTQERVGETTRQLVFKELSLVNALRNALERGEIEVHYQPINRLADGELAGFEALVRWPRTDADPIPPSQFIPVAEESGLVVPMGAWVLERAIETLRKVRALHHKHFPMDAPPFMSVNVSSRQLYSPRAVQRLADIIERSRVRPEQIKLEITESVMIEDPEAANRALGVLKELGVSIAVDDFGTGYSSLSYLQRFPVDTLKIDQSFVSTMLTNPSSLKILRGVSSLARELGMGTVAEGVETGDQYAQLRRTGCTYAQGFLLSRPVPVGKALGLVLKRNPR